MKYKTHYCPACGKTINRWVDKRTKNPCCDQLCARKHLSKRMSKMNVELNPTRMVPETKEKLRFCNIGKGEGIAYRKIYGRHTHRIVAEQKLGRALKKGEVVHHRDENKLNNHPDNIIIFSSQAEHARHHQNLKYIKENGI